MQPPLILAFVDGERSERDKPGIEKCISLLKEFGQKIPVEIVVHPHNFGSYVNTVAAITEVFQRYTSFFGR